MSTSASSSSSSSSTGTGMMMGTPYFDEWEWECASGCTVDWLAWPLIAQFLTSGPPVDPSHTNIQSETKQDEFVLLNVVPMELIELIAEYAENRLTFLWNPQTQKSLIVTPHTRPLSEKSSADSLSNLQQQQLATDDDQKKSAEEKEKEESDASADAAETRPELSMRAQPQLHDWKRQLTHGGPSGMPLLMSASPSVAADICSYWAMELVKVTRGWGVVFGVVGKIRASRCDIHHSKEFVGWLSDNGDFFSDGSSQRPAWSGKSLKSGDMLFFRYDPTIRLLSFKTSNRSVSYSIHTHTLPLHYFPPNQIHIIVCLYSTGDSVRLCNSSHSDWTEYESHQLH